MQNVRGGEVSPVLSALRARGERLTPQRLLVLDAVQQGPGHLTAEEIYERVSTRYPFINLATVYRALTWLKSQRLISETQLGRGQAEYEYLHGVRHHHLVCHRCGARQEIGDDLAAPLAEAVSERYGFQAQIDHLALYGICRRCQDRTAADQADIPRPSDCPGGR